MVVVSEGDVGFVDGLGGLGFEMVGLGSETFEFFILRVGFINCGPGSFVFGPSLNKALGVEDDIPIVDLPSGSYPLIPVNNVPLLSTPYPTTVSLPLPHRHYAAPSSACPRPHGMNGSDQYAKGVILDDLPIYELPERLLRGALFLINPLFLIHSMRRRSIRSLPEPSLFLSMCVSQ